MTTYSEDRWIITFPLDGGRRAMESVATLTKSEAIEHFCYPALHWDGFHKDGYRAVKAKIVWEE